jgi:hypothetical protein
LASLSATYHRRHDRRRLRRRNVVAPAFVALCVRELEASFHLPPPRHKLAAENVTQSLVDYAITFAWLAAPTDEESGRCGSSGTSGDEWARSELADKRYTTGLASAQRPIAT